MLASIAAFTSNKNPFSFLTQKLTNMAKHKSISRLEVRQIYAPRGETGQQLGVSASTLRRWRKSGEIKEGIHWIYRPGTKARVLYQIELLQDWLVNGNSPSHERAIERYVASLASSKSA